MCTKYLKDINTEWSKDEIQFKFERSNCYRNEFFPKHFLIVYDYSGYCHIVSIIEICITFFFEILSLL